MPALKIMKWYAWKICDELVITELFSYLRKS